MKIYVKKFFYFYIFTFSGLHHYFVIYSLHWFYPCRSFKYRNYWWRHKSARSHI